MVEAWPNGAAVVAGWPKPVVAAGWPNVDATGWPKDEVAG